MKPLHLFLKGRGAAFTAERVTSVTTARSEYRSFEGSSLLVPLFGSAALRVTGADRLDFLHGQVSSEVKRLQPGEASVGLLLNHKGHALADLRVLRGNDDLLLTVDGDAGAFVKKELDEHIIFDAVELEALDTVILALQGESAAGLIAEVLGVEAPGGSSFVAVFFQNQTVIVVPARRSAPGGFDLLVPAEVAQPLFEALTAAGAVAAGEQALNLARIVAGLPAAEFEGGEGVLPQEAGLEHAVSYTKGCYLGQEIMARLEARGKLRRSLQGLKLAALPDVSLSGSSARTITAGGKTVGRLGTVAEHPALGVVALAVLRNDLEPETVLEVGGVTGKPVPLPFV